MSKMTIESEVGLALIEGQYTLTSAESLTAGMFVSELASVSGISAVLPGAFVTYSAAAKHQLVGVSQELIDSHGVVSAEVAYAMAQGARDTLQTDFAISFTGVAGPDELEGHPAGTVFIGLVGPKQFERTLECHFKGDRLAVRQASVQAGMQMILDALRNIA